jgi:hypothetical protein
VAQARKKVASARNKGVLETNGWLALPCTAAVIGWDSP